jgi:hypothetical protein
MLHFRHWYSTKLIRKGFHTMKHGTLGHEPARFHGACTRTTEIIADAMFTAFITVAS